MAERTAANAEIEIKADFAQASGLIMYRQIGDERWLPTPYQVADAGHDSARALRLVDEWADHQQG